MIALDRSPGEALRELRHALELPVGHAAHLLGLEATELWAIECDRRAGREAVRAYALLAQQVTPVARRLPAPARGA